MDDLLPFYEQELTALRQRTKHFSERFPKIASRLGLQGESVEDPHVERLIESFAFLSARIRKKLEDEYPEFTESFLQVMYPHYLRPIPSCSIAHLEFTPVVVKEGEGAKGPVQLSRFVPRQTLLYSADQKSGVECDFQTVYPVYLSPLKITSARYDSILLPPPDVSKRVHAQASGAITVEFDLSGFGEKGIQVYEGNSLRVFMDAESSLIAQIREAVFNQTLQVVLEANQRWIICPEGTIKEVGFLPEEGLFHYDTRTPHAFRLLTEFFVFNEKFSFFDIDLKALKTVYDFSAQKFSIKFLLPNIQDQFLDERLLEQIETHHFKLHCTPVMNLFQKTAKPIAMGQTKALHPLLVDAKNPAAYELYDVLSMECVIDTPSSSQVLECRPLYALYHGDASIKQLYWTVRCDEELAYISPGHEYQMALIDHNFNPHHEETGTLSMQVMCTNRNLPFFMQYGRPQGDLFERKDSDTKTKGTTTIRLLRKPTKTLRFSRDRDSQWRLISHLNLNQLSIGLEGGNALKEVLHLYNVTKSKQLQKMIEGIADIQLYRSSTHLAGKHFPTMICGVQVVVRIHPEHFVGTGVGAFAQILDHYFARLVHANSFSQVIVQHAETKAEIHRCQPRNGHIPLV